MRIFHSRAATARKALAASVCDVDMVQAAEEMLNKRQKISVDFVV